MAILFFIFIYIEKNSNEKIKTLIDNVFLKTKTIRKYV